MPRTPRPARRAGATLLAAGLAGFALAFWGLWRDIGWIAQPFYAYAWWSYIFLLDGATCLARGRSLLTTRRHLVPAILLWSVSFWFFFELLNLRFQNWYYVGVYHAQTLVEFTLVGLFGVVCFATVWAGLFETYAALAALGIARRSRSRPRRLKPWVSYALQGVGAVMVALAVIWPYSLAPLVWGSLTFLLDPWNYRLGARSLLRDVADGRDDVIVRCLAAGLVCGLVWESLNYVAPQQWIYTVRGLEAFKLFEMPVLGFLGFPALALDSFAAWAAISFWLYGNATWEDAGDGGTALDLDPRPVTPVRTRAALLPLHILLWGVVVVFGQTVSLGSFEVRLEDLGRQLPAAVPDVLRAHGIRRPRQLLNALEEPRRKAALQDVLDFDDDDMSALLDETRLYTFKGIGADHGRLLQSMGIERVDQLRDADPESVYAHLRQLRGRHRFPALRLGMVRVWVTAARQRGEAQRDAETT